MNEENIKKYAELMKELGLTGMEITEDGKTLRLERMPAPPAPQAPQTVYVPEGAPAQSTAPAPSQAAGTPVTSPMVGIFYAAPAENAEPYVTVGTSVKKGDTLCIIEAMKLMNEIIAEQDGVISEICVNNGQVVEYGEVLFRIK